MAVRFRRSALLDRTEARFLAQAIREGIGPREGTFVVSVFIPMDSDGYEILIELPNGERVKLSCSGPSEMLPSYIRAAVNRTLAGPTKSEENPQI